MSDIPGISMEQYLKMVKKAAASRDGSDDKPPRGRSPEGPRDRVRRSTTPHDVAVMSTSVHTIAQRRRLLIRGQQPHLIPAAPSLNALRLLLELLFRVRAKSDHEFKELNISMPDLGRCIGLRYRMSREQAETLLRDLSSAVFTLRGDGEFVALPFMAISKLDHETGTARLKLNHELEPYLLGLESRYRQLHRSVFKLRSSYSVLLYVFARGYCGLMRHRHRVPLAELLSVMRAEGMPWAAFRKDRLEAAVAEINRRTELKISYDEERGGRTDRKRGEVDAVLFEIREQKAAVYKETNVVNLRLIPPRKARATPDVDTAGGPLQEPIPEGRLLGAKYFPNE